MSDAPEIAPEIRGLLEEIVADPRSSIRLVPQRALRAWFERGEPVRTREVAATRAERHLVEVHREALAQVLREASLIAFWKTPGLPAHLPIGSDGKQYDPARRELPWGQGARRILARTTERSGVELLRMCLDGIEPRIALSLAEAALGLVPSDVNRFQVAYTVPWDRPRTAIALLDRLASSAQTPWLRYQAGLVLGARTCSIGLLSTARDYYREASVFGCGHLGRFYSFHLSCCLRDEKTALNEAAEFAGLAGDAPEVLEAIGILHKWSSTRPTDETRATRAFVERISDRLPEAALDLFKAYAT